MGQTAEYTLLARELLSAVRDRLRLVAEVDPAEIASRSTIHETLAFVRLMHRQSRRSE
jgi:hypothetical protein